MVKLDKLLYEELQNNPSLLLRPVLAALKEMTTMHCTSVLITRPTVKNHNVPICICIHF